LVWNPFELEAITVSVNPGLPKTTPEGAKVRMDDPVGYCMEVL
jgi:hypothetical protein